MSPSNGKIIFPPFNVGTLLSCIPKKIVYNGTRISSAKVIVTLKALNVVSLGMTQLYNLSNKVSLGLIPKEATWTSMRTNQSLPFITPKEFNDFVDILKNKTMGGEALSVAEIKLMISDFIKDLYQKKNKGCLLPPAIPMSTLNSYLSLIKAQDVFNIFSSLGNKTES